MRPARRAGLSAAVGSCVALLTVACTLGQPTVPSPSAGPSRASASPGGTPAAIPDWRTDPNEPYPFRTPIPPLVATAVDGVYTREPTIEFDPDRAQCRRCPPYPHDAGHSTFTLRGGRFEMRHEHPDYRMEGHFVVEGDEVVFFNDAECTGTRGRYRWALEDDTLTLELVEDECGFGQRAQDFTTHPWTRMGDAPLSGVRLECIPPNTEAAISGHWPAPSGC